MKYFSFSRVISLLLSVILISGIQPALHAKSAGIPSRSALVFLTDFGLHDAAVSEMKGIAVTVSPDLRLYDVTHEIPSFDIWQAAYRLFQASPYWPSGTVFVSVVDPGVGGDRKSVVLKTQNGQYFVSPDNGSLTLVAESFGIEAIREIDEKVNRRKGTEKSYTFFGRDVYAYTGAKLASGKIRFEEVGPLLPTRVVSVPHEKVHIDNDEIIGIIPVLDTQFGNVWSNIDGSFLEAWKVAQIVHVRVFHKDQEICSIDLPYANTFESVPPGKPLLYVNSLGQAALALNMGNFAKAYHVGSGPDWTLRISKSKR